MSICTFFHGFHIFRYREEFQDDPEPALCCNEQQVDDIISNFEMAKPILGRCPTCFYNFRMNFCEMTCRPTQSEFLKVKTVMGKCDPCGNEKPDSRDGRDACNGHQSKCILKASIREAGLSKVCA